MSKPMIPDCPGHERHGLQPWRHGPECWREATPEELKAALWATVEHDDNEYYRVYDTYKTGGWRAVVLFLTGEEWVSE